MTDLTNPIVCCSCHEVPASAVESRCCHSLFCWDCGISRAKMPCPSCSQILNPEEFKESIAVNRILTNLQLRCRFEGCNQVVRHSDRKAHEGICSFAMIVCPNSENCGIIPRRELSQHLVVCPNREVQCHLCESRVRVVDLEGHIDSVCPEMTMHCPRGCDVIIRRKDMVDHQSVCEYEFVNCPAAPFCNARLTRGEMRNHVSASIPEYLMGVMEHIKAHDEEVRGLRFRIAELERASRFSTHTQCAAQLSIVMSHLCLVARGMSGASHELAKQAKSLWARYSFMMFAYVVLHFLVFRVVRWLLPRVLFRLFRMLYWFIVLGEVVVAMYRFNRGRSPSPIRVIATFFSKIVIALCIVGCFI